MNDQSKHEKTVDGKAQGEATGTPHHCQPSDYVAMIARLQQIEAGDLSPRDIDWRTQAGVLWRMLHYATRCTDAGVDAFLADFARGEATGTPWQLEQWVRAPFRGKDVPPTGPYILISDLMELSAPPSVPLVEQEGTKDG